jgi:hypothetical protein
VPDSSVGQCERYQRSGVKGQSGVRCRGAIPKRGIGCDGAPGGDRALEHRGSTAHPACPAVPPACARGPLPRHGHYGDVPTERRTPPSGGGVSPQRSPRQVAGPRAGQVRICRSPVVTFGRISAAVPMPGVRTGRQSEHGRSLLRRYRRAVPVRSIFERSAWADASLRSQSIPASSGRTQLITLRMGSSLSKHKVPDCASQPRGRAIAICARDRSGHRRRCHGNAPLRAHFAHRTK